MRKPNDLVPVLLGLLAIGIASTGTAVAATGQLVNVADPTSGVMAKVNSAGRLLVNVHDGSGPVTVDGTVEARISGGTAGQNPAASPYFTSEVQREPWMVTMTAQSGGACTAIPVPANRRVVVTNMSGYGFTPSDVHVRANGVGTNGVITSMVLSPVPGTGAGTPHSQRWGGSVQLELRIPATVTASDGSQVPVTDLRACLNMYSTSFVDATVAGYYERVG